MSFNSCTIIGLGLLGGSLAIDLRQHFPEMAITGVARRREVLEAAAALRCGDAPVFTHLTLYLPAAADAELVVLCTPVQTILQQIAVLAESARAGMIVTDVGSTKRAVMNAASAVLPPEVHFIGGHPMAGSERAGLEHARAGLYRNATWALCVPAGSEQAAARLRELIKDIGARPRLIDAETHDEIVALTSHLPHVTAGALVNAVLGGMPPDQVRPFLAGGFKDTTRIAAAHPQMWSDILLTNRDQLLPALDRLLDELTQWRSAIRDGDAPHLEALLATAKARREEIR